MPYESSHDSVHCHREVLPRSSMCPSYGHLKVAHAIYLLPTPLTSFRVLENCSQRLKRGASRHVITHIYHTLTSISTLPLPPPGTLVPGTSTPLMGACKTTLAPFVFKAFESHLLNGLYHMKVQNILPMLTARFSLFRPYVGAMAI